MIKPSNKKEIKDTLTYIAYTIAFFALGLFGIVVLESSLISWLCIWGMVSVALWRAGDKRG